MTSQEKPLRWMRAKQITDELTLCGFDLIKYEERSTEELIVHMLTQYVEDNVEVNFSFDHEGATYQITCRPIDNNFCGVCAEMCYKMGCGKCGQAFYCGKECQKIDWKEHKQFCGNNDAVMIKMEQVLGYMGRDLYDKCASLMKHKMSIVVEYVGTNPGIGIALLANRMCSGLAAHLWDIKEKKNDEVKVSLVKGKGVIYLKYKDSVVVCTLTKRPEFRSNLVVNCIDVKGDSKEILLLPLEHVKPDVVPR